MPAFSNMIVRQIPLHFTLHVLILCSLIGVGWASPGDRLPEFRRCVSVSEKPLTDLESMLNCKGVRRGELQSWRLYHS